MVQILRKLNVCFLLFLFQSFSYSESLKVLKAGEERPNVNPVKSGMSLSFSRDLPAEFKDAFWKPGKAYSYSYQLEEGAKTKIYLDVPAGNSHSPSGGYAHSEPISSYEMEKRLNPEVLKNPRYKEWLSCWRIFASGYPMEKKPASDWCAQAKLDAALEVKRLKAMSSNLDPLLVSRELVLKFGKTLGRDSFFDYVSSLDHSSSNKLLGGNTLESRVKVTSANSKKVFNDSILSLNALSRSERADTGIVYMPGYGTGGNRYSKMMEKMSQLLAEREGFHTYYVNSRNKQGPAVNNKIIIDTLDQATRENKQVMILSISKGPSDLLYALLSDEYKERLSQSQKDKIKIVLSMSGVNRLAAMAWWMKGSPSWPGHAVGLLHLLTMGGDDHSLNGIRALSKDPLQNLKIGSDELKNAIPHATWVGMSAFAEGPFGEVVGDTQFKKADQVFPSSTYLVGNLDGVMEVGSSMLPPDLGMNQWIVRLYGSHHCFDGWYNNGTKVTSTYKADLADDEFYKPGYQIMDNYLRALPAALFAK